MYSEKRSSKNISIYDTKIIKPCSFSSSDVHLPVKKGTHSLTPFKILISDTQKVRVKNRSITAENKRTQHLEQARQKPDRQKELSKFRNTINYEGKSQHLQRRNAKMAELAAKLELVEKLQQKNKEVITIFMLCYVLICLFNLFYVHSMKSC